MHARVKLEGIDGRAPQARGACGLIWPNAGNLTRSGHFEDWQTVISAQSVWFMKSNSSFMIMW